MHTRNVIFALLTGIFALLVAFAPVPLPQPEPAERSFQVAASSYAFAPAKIRVNRGDHVTIALTSTDVVHGLYIDDYDLQISADPGQTETLSFVANKSGVFRLRCSVTCGDLHPFMIGKLQVGPNILLWRGVGLAGLSMIGLVILGVNTYQKQPGKLGG
jgi:plastocyanin